MNLDFAPGFKKKKKISSPVEYCNYLNCILYLFQ